MKEVAVTWRAVWCGDTGTRTESNGRYRDDASRPANEPEAITSNSELKDCWSICSRTSSRTRRRSSPASARGSDRTATDTVIKVAVVAPERLDALLFLSPQSWEEPVESDTSTGVYATRGEQSVQSSPTLYLDTDTKTRFPADAALPIDRVLAALEEFRRTDERPTCVGWQESLVS